MAFLIGQMSPTERETAVRRLEGMRAQRKGGAEQMVNVLFALIKDQFSVTAPNSYVVNDDEGTRILFIVGMANAMVIKLQEAYYVPLENDKRRRAQS